MPSGLIQTEVLDPRLLRDLPKAEDLRSTAETNSQLQRWGAALVVLPVFLQAPWVRLNPFSACLFTAVLLAAAIPLGWHDTAGRRQAGSLLLGFSGSWLAGSLFWGWLRAHPSWHLPVEAIALPLAITGLGSRWRLGCAFYLSSLVGTAMTDLAMALTGVMRFWPGVVQAPLNEAGPRLHSAAASLHHPSAVVVIAGLASVILATARWMHVRSRNHGIHADSWAVAAAVLVTTVLVDGLFLLLALIEPNFSGLI
ncbi:MAG: DUF3120 domain-containing protein [Synechococcus sp.]